ncbi:tail fiber protein [Photorhabdus luminescens]|uniref:tail fiber protein n=1 Tax=Photorhabdus luminescens TaxID=29488 RepID=UPI0022401147|nr:tail fiber protein [Photorhabdus luminescens]MCW7761138.1 tail fiber protein [Photorhabdus luminescens subsp. venezuelensis]
MSQKNDFKAFSISNNANVVSQRLYEESKDLLTGFPPNDVPTHLLNKALRQSSTISSVLADFISTQSGEDVLDDGDIAKLTAQLNRALEQKTTTKVPDASLTQKGVVQLTDVVGNSDTLVATQKLVQEIINLLREDINNRVPNTRKVNGKALNTDISLSAMDVGALPSNGAAIAANKLATARTIAGVAFDGTDNINIPAGNVGAYTKAEVNNLINTVNNIPVGVPMPWPTAIPPAGWLQCNGAAFDKSKFPELAKVYPSGRLPDLRGEFIRGWDNLRGVDVGRYLLSNQPADIASHNHRLNRLWSHSNARANGFGTPSYIFHSVTKGVNYELHKDGLGIAIGLGGGGFGYMDNAVAASTGTETRPRNVAFNYIVRIA